MFKFQLKLILLAFICLGSSFSNAEVTNGAQCKEFLSPLMELRTNAFLFNDILGEFRNPLNQPLSTFRLTDGDYEPGSRVHTYVRRVQTTLMQCNQNCQGLAINNNATFNCSDLNGLTLLQVAEVSNALPDDAQIRQEEEENPENHFSDIAGEIADDQGDDDSEEEPNVVADSEDESPEPTTPIADADNDDRSEDRTSGAETRRVLEYLEETKSYRNYQQPTESYISM